MDEKAKDSPDDGEPVAAAPTAALNNRPAVKETKRAEKRKPSQATKKGRGRPRNPKPYPEVPLEKAIQIPQQIKEKNGGHPWTPADVAAALGLRRPQVD